MLDADRWSEALELARRAVDADGASAEASGELAAALLRAGFIDEAAAEAGRMAEERRSALGWVVLARVRSAEGRFDEAVDAGDRALELAPDDRTIVYWAGTVQQGRARSRELLERYLEMSEGDDADRIDGAEGTLRFYQAVGDRLLWTGQARPESFSMKLRPLFTPGIRGIEGHTIDAAMGPRGKRLRLLFDTGATGLFVLERIAKKGAFESLSSETTFGGGGDQRHRTLRGVFPRLAFEGLEFGDALVAVSSREIDSTGRYHGLVGIAPFAGYRITIDTGERSLRLDPGDADAEGAPYWVISGQMLVRVRVNDEQDALFLFDTGADGSVISQHLIDQVEGAAAGSPARVRGFGGRIENSRRVSGIQLGFQGRKTRRGRMTSADFSLRNRLGGVQVDGFLGRDLIGESTVVIDTVARRIRLVDGGESKE
ncbi:hypothetical protein ABI59_01985 [Acidobacteria bacterium Mor1]|nr:hypothetical protein ABI59_01985 [Acidobacteria bacterium Mor1]